MLRSLLLPEFFKLPKYTVSKPITVTAVSIRLVLRSDAPSHVSLTLLLLSALPTYFFFLFSVSLCSFQPESLAIQCFYATGLSICLSDICHSFLHAFARVVAASPLIQIQSFLKDHGILTPLCSDG